jgi:hypothetical protein
VGVVRGCIRAGVAVGSSGGADAARGQRERRRDEGEDARCAAEPWGARREVDG